MSILLWIILASLLMSLLSLIGLLTLFLSEKHLQKIILPLVALSSGALLGGGFLHMIPEAIDEGGNNLLIFLFVLAGFSLFFMLEQFISWHHCHLAPSRHTKPVTYLILIADGVHNFIGGIAIAGAFLVDIRLGVVTWIIAAAHEIPQELGDFGILIHGGWSKSRALFFNFLSSLTMLIGAILTYFLSDFINVVYLLPFAAGNFIYIAASDLIPEIKHNQDMKQNLLHFIFFLLGIGLLLGIKLIFA